MIHSDSRSSKSVREAKNPANLHMIGVRGRTAAFVESRLLCGRLMSRLTLPPGPYWKLKMYSYIQIFDVSSYRAS